MTRILLLVGLVVLLSTRTVAGGGVIEIAVIVNAHNSDSISKSDLEDIYLRKQAHWSSGDRIVPINLGPEHALRRQFDRVVLGMEPDEMARYWLDQRIRGGANAPRELDDPALVLRLVTRLDGAVGYVSATSDLRDVRVVAQIRNGKLLLR
jgi:ABC-type phosphate transport system substrate-binding protein